MNWESYLLALLAFYASLVARAHAAVEPAASLESCNVIWDSPGKNFNDSMPIGNGDLGLNVWTEQNGDLVFLIGKDDAWTEDAQLVKLGRVRVKLSPNPFVGGKNFRQELKLREGEIEISNQTGDKLLVWVDANHPVVHVEAQTKLPTTLQASAELWRLQPRATRQGGAELQGRGSLREWNNIPGGRIVIDPDTVLSAQTNCVIWCHRNERSLYPLVFENQHLESLLPKYPDPLLHRTFGICMKGDGLVSVDNQTLRSEKQSTSHRLDLIALTQQADTIEQWQKSLNKLVADTDGLNVQKAHQATQKWWNDFWERSWIYVSGSPDAHSVAQSYALQRWMNACAGRGAMAMKYNGSIFTVGQEASADTTYDFAKGEQNADYRNWGGNYWFQNTRHLYWPMIAAGDDDTLAPFFKMYLDALPLAADRTKIYFKHDGACFPETIFFWGLPNNNDFGWNNPDVIIKNTWIRHYVSGGLELTAMMLDRFDYTQDKKFATETLLPLAGAITTYYNEHWKRGADGKIIFDPAQAIETYQVGTINPAPDIAGLKNILPRLLALPENLTTEKQRASWQRLLADVPPLPVGRTAANGKIPANGQSSPDGKPILLPAEIYGKPGNVENPELYAVFPFRLFGMGKPDLEMARDTYAAKLFKSSTCWGQDGIEAALLGLTDAARSEVVANFTAYGGERFKWFWKQGHDAEPDMDNGGAGMETLQLMLLQCDGNRLQLFPAWPKDWDVSFKLHAPQNTIIEGVYRNGKLEKLEVTPKSRTKDVIQLTPQ
jgi:hypothetical protein